ncbi:tetratricopeptide repeat-containing sulfotransferase family protein [Sphingomonas psychrotolerans]|uniref:Pilus assembly protein n=1 Tax=Sphingomonas psychrotolerans TaxID=1327635 RepID=A0A2K8MK33_9SPHN|nr:tetratricopeptide repeat-containing sulfotransferase family protein [Sphingomonas psychrotolerans]ATY34223.1 pilus assembly protein [Sphingomonas psychrotolerans]
MLDLIQKPDVAGGPACPCGTGLSRQNCCELDPRHVEIVAPERHAAALTALTRAYHDGDRDTARRLAIEVLEISPGQREALGALFNVLRDVGQVQAAAAAINRLARLFPNDATIRSIAAGFFLQRNDMPHAHGHGRMLLRLAPEESVAHFLMGRIFLASGKAQAAEFHLQSAEHLAAPDKRNAPDLQAARAAALREQGRFAESRAIYERISGEGQLSLQILLDWASLEEAARDFTAAFALLDRAEAMHSGSPLVAVRRAGLHRRVHEPERALDALDKSASEEEQAGTLLSKGQILDSLGRYDEAFACFDACKARIRKGGGRYLAEEANKLVEGLKDFFTEGRTRLLPRAAVREASPQPIFILGFPRSGTTLVEQTLNSHPNISAGDELPIVNSIAQRAQLLLGSPGAYPVALSELWLGDRRGHIDTLRDLYLNEAHEMGAVAPGKSWFTDKMPLNETHLGLISLLFPKSPIIHLVRHPLDVVLSVFSNALTHGFYCASALESAATHYALIADLIAHYRSVMPLQYHAVRYEDLVTDQEREVRAMLDFIGEPFDPAVLAFHENARHARTASYAQVTEKLYTRSRFRYRNYLRHLEPVIPILEPAIERLGYSIER